MKGSRWFSPTVIGIVAAIGCGSGQPQSASAKTEPAIPAASAPAPQSAGPRGSAVITGSVRLEGAAPQREVIKMSADPVCQQQHASPAYSEDVAVNDQGKLHNVFVYVKEGLQGAFPAPGTPVTLTQSGCGYTPHVFGIQADQPLEIVNSDATLHNINAKPVLNQPFNVAQPVKGMKTTKKFSKPEVMVKFKCNVHPWMIAYAGVVAHPFFGVTDANGSFTISNLPAGTYTLEAWHEKYGTQTQTVTVGEGEAKTVEWAFKAP